MAQSNVMRMVRKKFMGFWGDVVSKKLVHVMSGWGSVSHHMKVTVKDRVVRFLIVGSVIGSRDGCHVSATIKEV